MLNLIKSRKNKEGGSKGNKRSGSKSEKTGRTRNEKNRNANIGKTNVVPTTNINSHVLPDCNSTNASLNDPTVQQLYHHYYSIAEGSSGPSFKSEGLEENIHHSIQSDSHLSTSLTTGASQDTKIAAFNIDVSSNNITTQPPINEGKEKSRPLSNKTGIINETNNTEDRIAEITNKSNHRFGEKGVDNNSNIMQEPLERPSSRSSMVSSGKRTSQPKLGTGGAAPPYTGGGGKVYMQQPHNTYLFEDDPGIMSEVETSSTRFRRAPAVGRDSKHSINVNNSISPIGRTNSNAGLRHPRTSPNQHSQSNTNQNLPMAYLSPNPGMFTEDDPGIMSEAETASTTRGGSKRSSGSSGGSRTRVSIPSMGSNSLSINNKNQATTNPQSRSVQFRYPIVSHQYPGNIGHHNHSGSSRGLFEEDDPGIMSEAETSSTPGRRRGQLLRGNNNSNNANIIGSSHLHQNQHNLKHDSDVLPVVRTPSKTLERPLGVVFLIYRGETKRALLPNEITSIITVKALFVRSFGSGASRLTMEYMDTPRVKIYMHDASKDTFYEIKDLSEIRDKTILKLFEADSSGRGPAGLGPSGLPPITNIGDEEILAAVGGVSSADVNPVLPNVAPEAEYVDSRSVRALKIFNRNNKQDASAYGMMPRPSSALSNTLPRNAFSSLPDADPSRSSTSMGMEQGMSSVLNSTGGIAPMHPQQQSLLGSVGRLGERSKTLGPGFLRSGTEGSIIYNRLAAGHQSILDNYYVAGDVEGHSNYTDDTQDNVNSYGHQQHTQIRSRFSNFPESSRYYTGPGSTEEAKERMMNMEAQLSQLTGMVEKALKHKKLAGKKTVSFDKAVSFSDDKPQPQGILTNSSHGSRHHKNHDRRSSDGSSGRDPHHNHHLQPNPKSSIMSSSSSSPTPRMMSPELYNQLRGLQRNARDLRQEVKILRRLTQLQSMAMKDLVQDTYLKLREACISFSTSRQTDVNALNGGPGSMSAADLEQWRLAQDEEIFSRELNELVQAISQLEAKVEEMRSGVINKKNKIGLADVENMALILSKSTKTVTQLKQVFPSLETNLRGSAAFQSSNSGASKGKPASVLLTEEFLRRTPERLENVWKRCKKLTGTLVTLKRLASVQEQRFHPGSSAIVDVNVSLSPTPPVEIGRANNIAGGGGVSSGGGTNQNNVRSASTTSASPATSLQPGSNLNSLGDRKMKDPNDGTLDDLLEALQSYSNTSKSSSGGTKKSLDNNSTSNTTSRIIPNINVEKETTSSSPLKRNAPLPTAGGKPLNKGGSFDLHMHQKEASSLGSDHLKNKIATDDNVLLQNQTTPRGSTNPATNGPTQNTLSSPSLKYSGGSSSVTKTAPPPPPPRTSSTQPVISVSTSGTRVATESGSNGGHVQGLVRKMSSKINSINNGGRESGGDSSDLSESSESINSQEGHGFMGNQMFGNGMRVTGNGNANNETPPPIPSKPSDIHNLSGKLRQDALETRHQELLTRQKQLQEQYERLQHMAQQKKGEKVTGQVPSPLASAAVPNISTAKTVPSPVITNEPLSGTPANNSLVIQPMLTASLGSSSASSSLSSSSSSSLSRKGGDKLIGINVNNQLPENTNRTTIVNTTLANEKQKLANEKNDMLMKRANASATSSSSHPNSVKITSDNDRGGCNLGSSGNETEESSNPEEDSSETTSTYSKLTGAVTAKKLDSSNASNKQTPSNQNIKKKIPPALPARGNSVITTVPSLSPRSSITSIEKTGNKDSEQTSVDSRKDDKTNCDTEQPPTCEKIIHTGSEKSQVDEKHSKAEGSNLNSSPDIVNSTSKKVYKTEMI